MSEPSSILVGSPTVVNVQSDLTRREIGYHPQIVAAIDAIVNPAAAEGSE